ncbi:MAG: CAP domain-containing protein [Oscillospiraceae bacterium]|nr:CAP domain-containing protein [Oscillospiraceae bacterium]
MKTKLLTIICMAVMLTACSNADSSTAVTTPAGQTTTTTTTTTEATETESKTDSQTSEDETVTSETTTTPVQTEEPTITTTTPEEITTTTTTAETTKPKVTTTTKKSTTTKKQTTTTKVTTTKPKTTTTTAKKTTTTTTTTTKKVEQPPEGRVMYSSGTTLMKKPKESYSQILYEETPVDAKFIVVGEAFTNEYGEWYNVYYNGEYAYCYVNSLTSLPSSRWDEELCNLINDYRESLGLEKLKIDQRLMEAAQIRLDEQKVSAGHTRPDGSSCFTVFDEVGISDESLGVENLGGGATPQVIFKGWKNSSGHNRNMTYANSVAMGVAFDIDRGSWVFLARTAESDE